MNLADIADALEGVPIVLRCLVRGLSDDQLRAGHDAGNWSIEEVLLHPRDTEEVMLKRYTQLATEENPFLAAFDQEAYARERSYQDADDARALAGVVDLRRRSVELFRWSSKADLLRPGVHEERGPVTLGAMAEHIVARDIAHPARISRVLDRA